MTPAQQQIFATAVNAIASSMGRGPVLYGPDNRPLGPAGASASYTFSKTAARRSGSLKNWIPKRLLTPDTESREREAIQERAADLVGSDLHADGIVDTFATTVIGGGLTPMPSLDAELLGISREEAKALKLQQRRVYNTWAPQADAGERMSFGAIQFLLERCLIQYGESFTLLPMRKDTSRRYSLACQVIHPLRVKTPTDKRRLGTIRDGIELGKRGEAVAIWAKKSEPGRMLSDHSKNFVRIPVRSGHRYNIIHDFVTDDPEQVRGVSAFAPAMKPLRDLNDYLDAELVSNVVTAAFALFIEIQSGTDPLWPAQNLASTWDDRHTGQKTERTRFQELIPGAVMYGNSGEKPHPIAANRPGATFQPFVREIKKGIAQGLGIPYPVLFKDVDGVSFAGFRSAMLEAWRVFAWRRSRMGRGPLQKIYTMLMEEAWLRGDLAAADFYRDMHLITACDWRGAPKGDIEPIKAAKADLLEIKGNLKTYEKAIAERGESAAAVFEQLEEEKKILQEKNLATSQAIDENGEQGLSGAEAIADAVVDAMEERK